MGYERRTSSRHISHFSVNFTLQKFQTFSLCISRRNWNETTVIYLCIVYCSKQRAKIFRLGCTTSKNSCCVIVRFFWVCQLNKNWSKKMYECRNLDVIIGVFPLVAYRWVIDCDYRRSCNLIIKWFEVNHPGNDEEGEWSFVVDAEI